MQRMTLERRRKRTESLGPFSFFMAHMENFGDGAEAPATLEEEVDDDIVDDIELDTDQWFHGRRSTKKISEGQSACCKKRTGALGGDTHVFFFFLDLPP